MATLRIGLIGAGANTRQRHIPGFRAVADVEIVAVCNRRPGSTAAVAREHGIRALTNTGATWSPTRTSTPSSSAPGRTCTARSPWPPSKRASTS